MSDDRLFCSECGTPNEGDAVFCESCGHRLDDTQAASGSTAGAEPQPVGRRRLSPALVALLTVVIVAGGALAFRARIASYLGSIGGSAKNSADSLQFAPVPHDVQLNDRPTGQQSPALAPPVILPGNQQVAGVQPASPRTPSAQPPGRRPQSVQPATPRQPDAQPSVQLPGRPAPFPEGFKPPEGATTSGSPAEASAGRNEGPTGIPAGAVVTRAVEEPAPARATGRIAAGSVLSLRTVDQVCTDKTREGARFKGVVQQEVAGSDGAAIPKGTIVTFVVDRLRRSGNPNDKVEFSVAAESIEIAGASYPVAATIDAVTVKPQRRGLLGTLAGVALGVTITKAAGGDTKSAIAGGVAGGAAGAIVGSQLKTGDGCIEKNAPIRITLGADLTMRAM